MSVCMHRDTERERRGEGETQKTFMERYHTTNAKNPQGLTGTARREEEEEGEKERVEERSTPFTALHMWTCVSREQRGSKGVHTTLLTHSLTHFPCVPPSLLRERERESAREEETKRERRKKRRTLAKTFFLQCLFFLHSLSH